MARITIPTPCHEDIERMSLTERGRFCASCKKNIFDFRKGSKGEFEQIVKNHPAGEVCGIVPSKWVEMPVKTQRVSGTFFRRLQVFAIALLVVLGPEVFGIANVAKAEIRSEVLDYFDFELIPPKEGDKKIKGRVTDEFDGSAAEGAMVFLVQNGTYLQRTVVDNDGFFEMVIPAELIASDDWKMEVQWVGQKFPIKPDLQDKGILELMIQAEIMLPEIEVVSNRWNGRLTGDVTSGVPVETFYVGITSISRLDFRWNNIGDVGRFQPTLEERIMMFSSEVISKDL